jgi:hypothetical protein
MPQPPGAAVLEQLRVGKGAFWKKELFTLPTAAAYSRRSIDARSVVATLVQSVADPLL